jgi:hypothetical protein
VQLREILVKTLTYILPLTGRDFTIARSCAIVQKDAFQQKQWYNNFNKLGKDSEDTRVKILLFEE